MMLHDDEWDTVELRYEAGDTFTLLGVRFIYDVTTSRYLSENDEVIYPKEIIFSISYSDISGGNITIAGAVDESPTANEMWFGAYSNNGISIRFDGQVVRSIKKPNLQAIDEIRLVAEDNSVWLDGIRCSNYLGTMKFSIFNGRMNDYHHTRKIVTKIQVR